MGGRCAPTGTAWERGLCPALLPPSAVQAAPWYVPLQSLAPSTGTASGWPTPAHGRFALPRGAPCSAKPSQGITSGNLSPSPALSALGQHSGLLPLLRGLRELSKHRCGAWPRPGTPGEPPGLWWWVRAAPPASGCASARWEQLPEDGCHEDGAKPSITPSTNWLPGFRGQGISELRRLMSLLCSRQSSPGQGCAWIPARDPGLPSSARASSRRGARGCSPQAGGGAAGQPGHPPPCGDRVPSLPSLLLSSGKCPRRAASCEKLQQLECGREGKASAEPEAARSRTDLLPPGELTPLL